MTYVPGSASGNLPKPTVQGGNATWQLEPLLPFRVVSGHIVLRSRNARPIKLAGHLTAASPDGRSIALQAKTSIRLVRREARVTVAADGNHRSASIQGLLTAVLSGGKDVRGTGSIVVRSSRGRSATLQPIGATASAVGAPSRLAIRVIMARASGFSACPVGTAGILRVVDSDALTRNGSTRDGLSRPARRVRWDASILDASPGGHLSVKLGFR